MQDEDDLDAAEEECGGCCQGHAVVGGGPRGGVARVQGGEGHGGSVADRVHHKVAGAHWRGVVGRGEEAPCHI